MKFVSYEPNRIRIFRCSCVKNFRESYVFHCLVIKVVCLATACLLYHISFSLSSTFFKFFSKFFELFRISELFFWSVIVGSVQATWLLYHKFSHLSTVNLNFLKTFLFFSISEAIPCDNLFTIPPPQGIVKHFFTKNPYFLYWLLLLTFKYYFSIYFHKRKYETYFLIIYRMASWICLT